MTVTAQYPVLGTLHLSPAKLLWFSTMLIPGVLLGIPALSFELSAIAGLLTFATLCFGHSVGLHRGLIHQSFSMKRPVHTILLFLDSLSGLGGPITWARIHAERDHWQKRQDCPQNFSYDNGMLRDFIWNLGYHYESPDKGEEKDLPDGLLQDWWMIFFQRTWLIHLALLTLLLWWTLGLDAVFVCICLRSAFAILGHWIVGYAAHNWGQRPYSLVASETGTNLGLLGVLSFGEGFHNNHHAYPRSARMGFYWYQFDLSWQVIRAGAALGLFSSVQVWPNVEASSSLE